MIAANERDAIGIAHFERQQQQKRLDRVEATIDEIAEEKIVRIGHVTADLEVLFYSKYPTTKKD